MVAADYALFPPVKNPDTGLKYTQAEREKHCADRVKFLEKDGNFLNSGTGKDENLNHPVIEEGIRGFVYKGKSSLASRFPETFGDSVPPKAVALVGAMVSSCPSLAQLAAT
ncbi:hypothetical protein B0H17DRAFT_642211 [Mycena rosella]|uniref:DUF6532 domain-containing protein n=1 Tax=Mycena rosella TaxID=1033263 RepID=A0AAD7GD55_MYCRO|nr:hypothetical protein B0H17DRAFT_642211 [Mycena rosella]